MNSILEQALVHLLNEEHEKAEELMHQFVVDRARSIHESLREQDEADCDLSELEEELFTEADLEDETAAENLEDDLGDAAMADEAGDEEAGLDMGDAADVDMGDEAAEGECEGDADCLEDKVEDLEAQLAELTAEFEAVMAEFEAGEGEEDLAADDADMGGDDMDAAADDMEAGDDMDAAADEDELVHEGIVEEDFEDITEGVVDELKKIATPNEDGKGATGQKLGGGEKVSTLKGAKADAKPIVRKSAEHKGWGLETAPGKKMNTTGDNIRARAETGTEKMSGYQPGAPKGGKGAEIAKPVKGNTKSNLPGGNPKPVK